MERKDRNKKEMKDTASFGPKVADIFLGDSPGLAPTVIHLPRIVHLHIARKEKEVGKISISSTIEKTSPKKEEPTTEKEPVLSLDEIAEDNLVFHFPAVADIPEPLNIEDVKDELDKFLAEEEQREEELSFRAETYRRNKRAEISNHLHSEPIPPSAEFHEKTKLSSVKRTSDKKIQDGKRILGSLRQFSIPKDEKDVLLRSIMQRDVEGNIPWVAPPVSWNTFRKKSPVRSVHDEERSSKYSASKQKRAVPVANKTETPEIKQIKKPNGKLRIRKESVWEAARVGVGVLVVGMIVGLISSVSAAPQIAGVVEDTAKQGANHLMAGLKAISVADVSAGKQELNAAEQLFTDAQERINSSTSLAVRLLARLDPKERYIAGENLLEAGKKLSALGSDAGQLTMLFQQQDKTDSFTDALEKSFPLIEKLAKELKDVDSKIKDISPEALPKNMQADLLQLQGGVHSLSNLVTGYLNSHDVLLELLGARQDRQYLFLFENNREIRPGGGFIGSFALADVKRGKVKKVHVDTIYNPDGQLKDFLVPPAPLQKITDRWFTRDANWFADYRDSARKVAMLFERSGGPTVDGVIAITPTVLEQMLRVTGPVPMPQYKVTVTSDNVIDETQRLVTFEYDKEENNPKAFISDLLPEVLDRLMKLPRERWGDLVSVFSESLKEKQILIWLREQDAQAKVENLGWSGAIEKTEGDYLLRSEANIGGHKTDDLVEQSVDYDVSVEADGSAVATLVTTRHHTGSPAGRPGWDQDEDWYSKANVIYERTLVPQGSVLLEARGFTKDGEVPTPYKNSADYRTFVQDQDLAELDKNSSRSETSGTIIGQESGKTSFGNWIVTRPGETTVTVYKYRLPFTYDLRSLVSSPFSYQLLIQQQPGHRPVHTEATLRLPPGFKIVWGGPEGGVTFEGDRKATFTGEVASDSVWGIVVERL